MRISDISHVTSRRAVLGGLSTFAAVVMLAGSAAADPVSRATAHVSAISAELTKLVNSGAGASKLNGEFERILARYADMAVVGSASLGRPWRSATKAQKQAFVPAFQGYLARKYGRQFGEFRNASIKVTGGRDAGKAGVIVSTLVERPGQENIAVDWQISERSGKPKAVNLITEGVSLLANERAEVGAMLDAQGGDIDKLIAHMKGRS